MTSGEMGAFQYTESLSNWEIFRGSAQWSLLTQRYIWKASSITFFHLISNSPRGSSIKYWHISNVLMVLLTFPLSQSLRTQNIESRSNFCLLELPNIRFPYRNPKGLPKHSQTQTQTQTQYPNPYPLLYPRSHVLAFPRGKRCLCVLKLCACRCRWYSPFSISLLCSLLATIFNSNVFLFGDSISAARRKKVNDAVTWAWLAKTFRIK